MEAWHPERLTWKRSGGSGADSGEGHLDVLATRLFSEWLLGWPSNIQGKEKEKETDQKGAVEAPIYRSAERGRGRGKF